MDHPNLQLLHHCKLTQQVVWKDSSSISLAQKGLNILDYVCHVPISDGISPQGRQLLPTYNPKVEKKRRIIFDCFIEHPVFFEDDGDLENDYLPGELALKCGLPMSLVCNVWRTWIIREECSELRDRMAEKCKRWGTDMSGWETPKLFASCNIRAVRVEVLILLDQGLSLIATATTTVTSLFMHEDQIKNQSLLHCQILFICFFINYLTSVPLMLQLQSSCAQSKKLGLSQPFVF